MKKKVLSIILLMAMALSAFGCGKVNVKLANYKGLELTKVTDKQVEDAIKALLEENEGSIVVDRESKKDDTVNMNYEGIYYGDISLTFKFELEKDYDSYSFIPGTLDGAEFTPLYTEDANNLVGLTPAVAAASGSNHYLDANGAIVVSNKEATSLTIAIKADYVKEIIEKKLSFTAKTNGVKVTSIKVLAVSSTEDKDYACDSSYVGDGKYISTVSYEAFSNVYGVKFSGGTAEKADLKLGSGDFIPGFEDQLIGYKAGETLEVKLSFPNNYTSNTRLSNQPVIFKVKINEVKEDPKFDDAFAKFMEHENAEEYRKFIIDTMNNNYFEEQITEYLIEKCKVKNLPKKEYQEYVDNFVKYYTSVAQQYVQYYAAMGYSGLTVDFVLANMFGVENTAALREAGEDEATHYLSLKYIVNKIVSGENITYTDEEYKQTEKDYAINNGYDSVDKFYEENIKTDSDKADLKEDLEYITNLGKVLDLIKSTAVIKEADNTKTEEK